MVYVKSKQGKYAVCDASGMSYVWRAEPSRVAAYPMDSNMAVSILDTMRARYPEQDWEIVPVAAPKGTVK